MLQFLLKNKKVIFLLGLFIVSLTLFATDVERRKPYTLIDKIILAVFVPPLKATTSLVNSATAVWEEYFYLVNLRKENTALKASLEKLYLEHQMLKEQAIENSRLRELLSFKKKLSYTFIPAETIGRDPSSWFKSMLINKGAGDGIVRGSGVITPLGIVGKIIQVSHNASKILLIIDVNSSVDAIVERTRARGIVEGVGSDKNLCKLSYVLKSEDIVAGDVILCSGTHGINPKGIIIGTVSRVEKDLKGFFQLVEVRPSVDFSQLNEVLVVLKKKAGDAR